LKNIKNRFNHNYAIVKTYSPKKIFKILEKGSDLPDRIMYSNSDYNDSLRRVRIIKELIERDGCHCMKCGEVPTFFGLGKDFNGYFHLDLYSYKDKTPYMYTIDHVHPKSKGGTNTIENYQLLCKICNEDKSDTVEGEEVEHVDNKMKNYIKNKLKALDKQTNAMLTKLKRIKLIPIKEQDGFTLGNIYKIIDIKTEINTEFNSNYIFFLKNDNSDIVPININNFLTKKDVEITNN